MSKVNALPPGVTITGSDIYTTTGNEGVVVNLKTADGTSSTGSLDLASAAGRKGFLETLQELGVDSKALPGIVSGLEVSGTVSGLTSDELSALRTLASSIAGLSGGVGTGSNMAGVQGQWADFIAKKATGGAMDINALVEFVLRESYQETNKDLQFFAQKVRFYNQLKKQIRDELTKAREFMATKAGAKDADDIGWIAGYPNSAGTTGPLQFSDTPVMDEHGNPVPADPVAGDDTSNTKAGLDTYIKNLEEKLNSVGDDAQLANVDLQNILQKQQQTLQMMSNISKMLHDTALAIIRKIGG
jgi:hypothetical protein